MSVLCEGLNPCRCVCVSVSVCVFVCLFWGFTPYLRPIFTQQPQGEITSYSPAQLCFLSVSTTTGGMSHHVYLPARKTESERKKRQRREMEKIHLGWSVYTTQTLTALTLLCRWNKHTGMHKALQNAKRQRVTVVTCCWCVHSYWKLIYQGTSKTDIKLRTALQLFLFLDHLHSMDVEQWNKRE